MNFAAPSLSKGTDGAGAGSDGHADVESQAWIDGLDPRGDHRETALAALHALLLEATRFEVRRHADALAPHTANGCEAIAVKSADDALATVLAELDHFEGRSHFTTWACKFALAEAALAIHRFEWLGRSIPAVGDRAIFPPDQTASADRGTAEFLGALDEAIHSDLSPEERDLLVSVALDEVPLDVLADRAATTRSALYRTIHDARQKLRAALTLRGFSVAEFMEADRR